MANVGNAEDRRNALVTPSKDTPEGMLALRQQAEVKRNNTAQQQAAQTGKSTDPYGQSAISTQSMRRRGDVNQQRVGLDTRVRQDASSGTAGATGTDMGAALDVGSQQDPVQTQNYMWQAQRQPTDVASVQNRVLTNLAKLRRGA